MKKANWLKLGSLTGISRILGLIRDVVCAHTFGASAEFDAFIVAFQIPNFMRRLFAEGAMAQAFVPIYSGLKPSKQKAFASITLILIFISTFMIVLTAWFAGKGLICLYAPGFAKGGQLTNAVQMLKWTMPYITAVSIVTICSGIQNTQSKFMLTGAIPLLLNIILIIAAMISKQNIMVLAYGVFIAGILQAIVMLINVRLYFGKLQLSTANPYAKELIKLMSLGAIAAVIGQLGIMLETFLASWLDAGTVSTMYFAQRLVFLPIGIIAVAIATVLTPELAKLEAQDPKFRTKISWGCSLIWKLSWPASFGLAVLAPTIVKIVFMHGAFNLNSAKLTTTIIIFMSLGIPAFMLNKVFIAGLYAQKKVKAAIKIMSKCLIVNFIFGVFFMYFWQQTGIALAAVLSAWLQLLLLNQIFKVKFISYTEPSASLLMGITIVIVKNLSRDIPDLIALPLLIAVGAVTFELCLRLNNKSLIKELKFSDEVI